jgi:hypothetical protein
MFLVNLQLSPNDLAAHMCDMRAWLDRHNVETSGFSYKEGIGCAVARVEFRVKRQVEAFSAWFANRMVPAGYPLGPAPARSQAQGMHGSVGSQGLKAVSTTVG